MSLPGGEGGGGGACGGGHPTPGPLPRTERELSGGVGAGGADGRFGLSGFEGWFWEAEFGDAVLVANCALLDSGHALLRHRSGMRELGQLGFDCAVLDFLNEDMAILLAHFE